MNVRLVNGDEAREWLCISVMPQAGPEEGGDLPYFTWSFGVALQLFLYHTSPNTTEAEQNVLKLLLPFNYNRTKGKGLLSPGHLGDHQTARLLLP